MQGRILVMGANSRVGRMLRRAWTGEAVVWQARAGADLDWSLDDGAAALALALAGVDCLLCLAGATPGAADFSLNRALAEAAVDAGARAGCRRVLLASTMAVYGAGPGPHREDGPCAPAPGSYGASKLEMERAVAGRTGVTALRLGNVVGADMLFSNHAEGRAITLDVFPDGSTPRRSYVDPATLARILAILAHADGDLPAALNLATDPPVSMGSLLDAAGIPWRPQPVPQGALPEVSMDLGRLRSLVPLPDAGPDALIDGWRQVTA